MICLIANVTHLKRMVCLLSDHTWDSRPFKKCFFSQNIAFPKVAFRLNEMIYLLIGEHGFLGQVMTLPWFSCWRLITFYKLHGYPHCKLLHLINIPV